VGFESGLVSLLAKETLINDASIVRLVGALLLEQQEEWQLDGRRVFSELSMTKLENTSDRSAPRSINSCTCCSCLLTTLRSGHRPRVLHHSAGRPRWQPITSGATIST